MIETFFVIDFDRCIGNVDASFNLLATVLGELSIIKKSDLQLIRLATEAKGESFDAINYITELYPEIDFDNVKKMYIERAENIRKDLLEPGADEYMQYLSSRGDKYCIMTYGSQRWQQLKIEGAGFSKVPLVIVNNKRKGDYIANWFDKHNRRFNIPGICFSNGGGSIAKEVVLVDDKATAFVGLPAGARGYLVQGSAKISSSDTGVIPNSVKRVSRINQIINN